jgi:integrase
VGRQIGRLTELQVRRLGQGKYHDGGGLYLRIEGKAERWWFFRYGPQGRRCHGLGPLHTVSLSAAREQARLCRQLLLEGIDPIAAGKARRAAVKIAAANSKTLAECIEAYHASHCAGWTNRKHAREWKASLTAHIPPAIGTLPVSAVGVGHVLRVLEPIWTRIPETATRVRSRIESVLEWARVHGYRGDGANPARWRGHLDHLLPDRKRLARVKHHAALPYRDAPAFMGKLLKRDEIEARALAFVLLTASRAGEACGADWREIDLAHRLWTIPPERMKGRREHRVPLSTPACALLEQTPPEHRGGYVFPNATRPGRPTTVIALWRLAQELTDGATTVHGLRSTFRDWAAEQTDFPREVAEMALAHIIGDGAELAYRRSDLLRKRQALMEAWAAFSSMPAQVSGNVTPIGTRARG